MKKEKLINIIAIIVFYSVLVLGVVAINYRIGQTQDIPNTQEAR